MSHNLFRLEDADQFGWEGIAGYAISSKDDYAEISTSIVEVAGRHGKALDKMSTLVYFVIDGQGTYVVGDNEFQVVKSDTVIIPKNTTYDFYGKMKLFLVMTPAFDPINNAMQE